MAFVDVAGGPIRRDGKSSEGRDGVRFIGVHLTDATKGGGGASVKFQSLPEKDEGWISVDKAIGVRTANLR